MRVSDKACYQEYSLALPCVLDSQVHNVLHVMQLKHVRTKSDMHSRVKMQDNPLRSLCSSTPYNTVTLSLASDNAVLAADFCPSRRVEPEEPIKFLSCE